MPTYDDDGRLLVSLDTSPVTASLPPSWAFKNRLTSSTVIATDYTDVTGPVLTLESGVTLTLQSNAWLIIVG